MQKIKIISILILTITYISSKQIHTPVNPATYQLMHANIFHLLCNCWCIYTAVNDRLINKYLILPVIFASGVFAYIIASPDTTTVGFSGALLAMTGINITQFPTVRNWIFMSILFTVWFFVPVMSFPVHAISFLTGLCIGYSIIIFKRHDSKRNITYK